MSFFLIVFQYNIDSIQWYSHQHHLSLSAINTVLFSISFKPVLVYFAIVIHMLALSVVLIFSIVNSLKSMVANKIITCEFNAGMFVLHDLFIFRCYIASKPPQRPGSIQNKFHQNLLSSCSGGTCRPSPKQIHGPVYFESIPVQGEGEERGI